MVSSARDPHLFRVKGFGVRSQGLGFKFRSKGLGFRL